MITQQQNEGKSAVVLDDYLTKKEFYAEMRPIRFDNSGYKADILGLKVDVSMIKTDIVEIKKDISNVRKEMTSMKEELKEDIKEVKEDLTKEATSIRKEISDLTLAMCQQIQRVIDLIDSGVTIKQNI